MFKAQKGLYENRPLLTKKNEMTGPTSDVKVLITPQRILQIRLINDFSHSVSVRHKFFWNSAVPTWISLPIDVVTSSTVNNFNSVLNMYYKEFECYRPKGVGFKTWEPQQNC